MHADRNELFLIGDAASRRPHSVYRRHRVPQCGPEVSSFSVRSCRSGGATTVAVATTLTENRFRPLRVGSAVRNTRYSVDPGRTMVDAIVIGAGPNGLAAADILAGHG